MKDQIPKLMEYSRTFSEKESAISNHINSCSYYTYIENLFRFNKDLLKKHHLILIQSTATPE